MRACRNDFPGVDRQTSDYLVLDVKADEEEMIKAIAELRRTSSVSLEAIAYLLGSEFGPTVSLSEGFMQRVANKLPSDREGAWVPLQDRIREG